MVAKGSSHASSHHSSSSSKCDLTAPKPPIHYWNTTDIVAWKFETAHISDYDECCAGATITSYKAPCYKFCNSGSNSANVLSCLEGKNVKAKTYHDENGGKTSGAIQNAALSKGAIGLALMVATSFLAGTI